MGICLSSEVDEGGPKKGVQQQQAPSAAEPIAADGGAAAGKCADGSGAAPTACPFAAAGGNGVAADAKPPGSEASANSVAPLRSGSSCGAPVRSAMRTSIDGGGALTTRRSISGSEGGSSAGPRVRFAANTNTAEYERSELFASSDSLSLAKVLDVFYTKVLADPQLGPFFKSADLPKLKSHQVKFMALAFGGKELVLDDHPNLNLRRIHWKLIKERGLNEGHWEKFYDRFKEALDSLPEIPDETKRTAIASVATTRVYFRPLEPAEEACAAAVAADLRAVAA